MVEDGRTIPLANAAARIMRDCPSCRVCHREKCPNQGAPFDRKPWESIQHS